eukprot:g6429.t1
MILEFLKSQTLRLSPANLAGVRPRNSRRASKDSPEAIIAPAWQANRRTLSLDSNTDDTYALS